MSRFMSGDGSSLNVEVQENCMKYAVREGMKSAALALAVSATTVLGAARVSPGFNRSLNVSAKTALIISPAFGAFFLLGELAMNECAQRNRHLQQTAREEKRRLKAHEVKAPS